MFSLAAGLSSADMETVSMEIRHFHYFGSGAFKGLKKCVIFLLVFFSPGKRRGWEGKGVLLRGREKGRGGGR